MRCSISTLLVQDTAAFLGAVVAFHHPVANPLRARLTSTLAQARKPRMQNLSSALLSLARIQSLPSSLWQQHCFRLERELPEASGAPAC